MDQDDDVERLFSWLQTPELRYREFAGAREVTDTVITYQSRANTVEAAKPTGDIAVVEEGIVDKSYQLAPGEPVVPAHAVAREPTVVAPAPAPPASPTPAPGAGPFALGPAGRGGVWRPAIVEPSTPVAPPPSAPVAAAPPPSAPVSLLPAAPPPAPSPAPPQDPDGGLLGGAYREQDGAEHASPPPVAPDPPPPAQDEPQRSARSLDAVFGRLSGGRARLPDPRERLRHIPGLGPVAGRTR